MNTFAATKQTNFSEELSVAPVSGSFFRKWYLKIFHWWLYIDQYRVMRDYRKGRLHTVKSLDDLMK